MTHAPYSSFTHPGFEGAEMPPRGPRAAPPVESGRERAGFESGVFRRRPRSATQARILLADPDLAVRTRVGAALTHRGYDVVFATTAQEAASHLLDGLDLVVSSFDLSHAAFGSAPVIALERPVVIDQVLDHVLAVLIEAVMCESSDFDATDV